MIGYIQGKAWEDTSPYLMARIVDGLGNLLTTSTVQSVSYSVIDLDDESTPIISGTAIPVSEAIFNSLQTDSRWTKDSTGYNFAYSVPITSIPTGQKTYIIDFQITPNNGAAFPIVFSVCVLKRRYSLPT